MNIHTKTTPIQANTPIRFSDQLPDEADAVIIGGGVIGMFSALYMARAGLKVVLCEKGRIAGEQSSRNWGWLRQHGRDRDELPVMMEALKLWEEADKKTGGKTGFKRGGVCYLASNEASLKTCEKWLETAKQCQLDTRLISKAEIDKLINRTDMGANAHQWIGATYTPNDARVEPWAAIPAIAELAQSEGVIIRENCAARALDIQAGKITAVITESGTIKTSQVVLAAGAWSSLFARRHGVNIPQLSVRSTACSTVKLPEFFTGNASDEELAFRRREDGGYNLAGGAASDHYLGPDSFRNAFKYLPVFANHIGHTRIRLSAPKGFPDNWFTARNWAEDEISPFEQTRVLNPAPNLNKIEPIRELFAKRFPAIGKPEIKHVWAGMIDAMPDIVPIVDRVPALDGLIIATGMSGHGFGIGPGFGKAITHMVQGKPTGHDMNRFRFSRFTDGSKLVPGPDM